MRSNVAYLLLLKKRETYVPGLVTRAISFVQNKYSLHECFFVQNGQIVIVSKLPSDWLSRPENQFSVSGEYIVLYFSSKKAEGYQFYYPNSLLSQQQIYFNAFNNYEPNYIYTNVAASILTSKFSLNRIYSVQGIPLSFVDDTLIEYVFSNTSGIEFLKGDQNPYAKNLISPYPYKNAPDGKKQIFDNYTKTLIIGRDFRVPSFDRLIVYNFDRNFRYYLQFGANKYSKANSGSGYIDQKLIPIMVPSSYNFKRPNELPQQPIPTDVVFNNPIITELPFCYTTLFDNTTASQEGNYFTVPSISYNIDQINNGWSSSTNNDGQLNDYAWDCMLAASTPIYGGESLTQIIGPTNRKTIPMKRISRDMLIKGRNFDFDKQEFVDDPSTGLLELNEISTGPNRDCWRFGVYCPASEGSLPLAVYGRSYELDDTQPGYFRLPFDYQDGGVVLFYYTLTILIFDYQNFEEFFAPARSLKINSITIGQNRDYLTPSNYILGAYPYSELGLASGFGQEVQYLQYFGIKSLRVDEYYISSVPNCNAFYDLGSEVFQAPTDDYNVMKTFNAADTSLPSFFNQTVAYQDNNYFLPTTNVLRHTVDDVPFNNGMRMLQNSFDMRRYFKFRYIRPWILKKTWKLELGNNQILPDILTSPYFDLNSNLVSNYTRISCMLLPDYSLLEGGNQIDYKRGKRRGISIKCSLSRPRRSQLQYLYLEKGNGFSIRFDQFLNSPQFRFELHLPTVLPNYSTIYREATPANNFSTNFTVYMFFLV